MAERVDRALMYARELFQGLRRTSKIERAQEHAEYVATAIEVALEGVCFECEMMRGGGEIAQRQRTIRGAQAGRTVEVAEAREGPHCSCPPTPPGFRRASAAHPRTGQVTQPAMKLGRLSRRTRSRARHGTCSCS
jgi:hypothetical protein